MNKVFAIYSDYSNKSECVALVSAEDVFKAVERVEKETGVSGDFDHPEFCGTEIIGVQADRPNFIEVLDYPSKSSWEE